MFITASEARRRLAEVEEKFEKGRIRQVHEWQMRAIKELPREYDHWFYED